MVARLQQENTALQAEMLRLKVQHEVLAELAYVDSLTGLANRRAFDLHLEREWALTLRDGIDSYVVVADLDRFKALNDACGHAAGDQVLRQFADRTARGGPQHGHRRADRRRRVRRPARCAATSGPHTASWRACARR